MINNLSKLPGGVGDDTQTSQVDPNQLSLGVQIEMEHTNDPDIAKEIAMDHLKEDPKYYTKLVSAGWKKLYWMKRKEEKKVAKRESQNQQIPLCGLELRPLQDPSLMFIQVLMLMDGQLDGINPKVAVGE